MRADQKTWIGCFLFLSVLGCEGSASSPTSVLDAAHDAGGHAADAPGEPIWDAEPGGKDDARRPDDPASDASDEEDAARNWVAEEPGTELVELSECTGVYGNITSIPGNPATTVAAFDAEHAYATWLADGEREAVVVGWDGTDCTDAVVVNETYPSAIGASHDAPSVYVDGEGYVYATYFGRAIYREEGSDAPAPFIRRTVDPHDLDAWLPEERGRLDNFAELHGFPLRDGALLIAGSDHEARIDIIEPGGDEITYRWEAARQVVSQNKDESGSNPEPGNPDGCRGNRFTKAVFARGDGSNDNLYVIWGWGGGYSDGSRPDGYCEDIRHYNYDSHELYFAMSEDGGVTWTNFERTKTVESKLCTSREACGSVSAPDDDSRGIVHNDPAFRVTEIRQREHRRLWVEEDGTVYIAFEKSRWCDRGVCTSPDPSDPGALMLLILRPDGEKVLRMIDPGEHHHMGGIRKAGDEIYVWAVRTEGSARLIEYVSRDEGETWESREVIEDQTCGRAHGWTMAPWLNSVRILAQCSGPGDSRRIYYYRRSF